MFYIVVDLKDALYVSRFERCLQEKITETSGEK